MTLILVEGLDRAGKTTRCRELMAEPRERPRLMVHFVAPPRGRSPHEKRMANAIVLDEILFAYKLAAEHPEVDFVLDRGHVSWLAYEELLRGNPLRLDALRRIEAQVKETPARVEHVMVHDPLVLVDRDDGLSTYTRPTREETHDAAVKETEVFERVLAACAWPVSRRVTG